MQKPTLVLLFLAVIALIAGAVYLPQLLAEPAAPVMHWNPADEVDGSQDEPDPAAPQTAGIDRTTAEISAVEPVRDNEARIEAILRGRVLNKFQQPVAGAKVWLEIGQTPAARGGRGGNGGGAGRGNRPRRIPEPVITNEDGRFAFQGEAFRNLQVSLQVKHDNYAAGLFTEPVGDILANAESATSAEVNLKDVVLKSGGTVRGRVTDLDGNAVVNAAITVEPDGRNPLRWQRNREELLPSLKTDGSGFYSFANVPADGDSPDFTVSALAKMHTPGRSQTFQVAEDQIFEVPDIQLGPGYEVTGFVRDQSDRPIANADVNLRTSLTQLTEPANPSQPGAGPGQPGRGMRAAFGRGRDHRTKTDETGRFFIEHLPGSIMELTANAKGYLDYKQDGIDVKLGQLIQVAMADGLRITGTVTTPNGAPVLSYAMRAVRMRGLPNPNLPQLDMNDVMTKLREGNLDPATQTQLMEQMRSMRDQFGGGGGPGGGPGRGGDPAADQGGPGGGRGGRGGNQRGGGAQNELDKPEAHSGGKFVADGLQEGVYEVHIQATDFARYQSAEIEVRHGVAAPDLSIVLDAGIYVGGVVIDDRGDPVVGAEVELRTASLDEATANQPAAGNAGGRQGGMDFNRMAQMWMRGANGAAVSMTARTDRDGLFVIKHVQRGVYRLTASADGFAQQRGEPFQVDNNKSDFELVLQPLGSIVGKVTGFLPDELGEVSVGAVVIAEGGGMGGGMGAMFGGRGGRGGRGGNGFQTAKVEADGSYRLDGLNPGNYVVRSWIGSTRQLMQELGPDMFSGNLQPDVSVRGGQEAQWNMALVRPQLGTVTGNVLHNGNNASGFRVELKKQGEDTTQPQDQGGRGGRGRGGMFGRNLSATVSAAGEFTIKEVPAGLYELSITADRRGGTLLREPIQVFADGVLQRTFSVESAALKGTITTADGSDIKTIGGRVSLVPNQTAAPAELGDWLRQNNAIESRLRDGAFEFESVPPGSYLLVLQPRNRAPTTQQVAVQGDAVVTIAVGVVVATPAADANSQGNAPQAPGGARGNRAPGGNRRGG